MIQNIYYFLLCKNCAKAGINLNYAKKEIYIKIYIIYLLNPYKIYFFVPQ